MNFGLTNGADFTFRGYVTQACWLRPSNDFQPLHLVCSGFLQNETARFRRVSHPANPFSQASGETVDRLSRSRVAIPRSAHASTRRSRQLAQIDNDKVAPECNAAVCPERDSLQARSEERRVGKECRCR